MMTAPATPPLGAPAMRLPRPRFTLRWLVAVVAIVGATFARYQHRLRSLERSRYHAERQEYCRFVGFETSPLPIETMRTFLRRLARLSLSFSKKLENLTAAVALHFAHFNFCRRHSTIRVTPAMQAGVTDSMWSVADLIG
jgi:hypothetical protein